MRTLPSLRLALALVLGLTCHAGARAQGDAKAVIEKGIAAQGGAQNLDKTRVMAAKGKGTMTVGDMELACIVEVRQQQPYQARADVTVTFQGKELVAIQVLNGDKGWRQLGGVLTDSDAQTVAVMRDDMYSARVQMLTPLLSDKGFTLTALGESKVNGKAAVGVKVSSVGQKDVQLFFDKTSGLLVKLTRPGFDLNAGKAVAREEFFSEYKEFDGVKVATRVLVTQDGRRAVEVITPQISFPAKLDAKLFARPQ
jgi:hypothetical protein